MTLTIGTGPFGDQSTEGFDFAVNAPCDHAPYLEDSPRWLQVEFNDGTSRRVSLLHESGLLPVYWTSSRRAEHHLDDASTGPGRFRYRR